MCIGDAVTVYEFSYNGSSIGLLLISCNVFVWVSTLRSAPSSIVVVVVRGGGGGAAVEVVLNGSQRYSDYR